MFNVGDWVYIKPGHFKVFDNRRGVVENVISAPVGDFTDRQLVKIYWEELGNADNGHWPSQFLLKV